MKNKNQIRRFRHTIYYSLLLALCCFNFTYAATQSYAPTESTADKTANTAADATHKTATNTAANTADNKTETTETKVIEKKTIVRNVNPNANRSDCCWHAQFTPYGWGTSINSDVTVRGFFKHSYIPFSTLIKHFEGGAEAHMEAGRGPWSLMIDPTFLKVGDHANFRHASVSLTSKTTLIDSGIFYRVFAMPLSCDQYFSIEVLGGTRYLRVNNQFDFASGLSLTKSESCITAIFGGRIKHDFNCRSHAWVRADVGGFDVGHVIMTWSTTAGFAYTVRKHFDVGIAYRILKIDYRKHPSSKASVTMYGPMVGVSFYI